MVSKGQLIGFTAALAKEQPRIVRLCMRYTGDWQTAEDLAQEVAIVAWKKLSQLSSLDGLGFWLSAIARNVCLNWSRQHHRENLNSLSSFETDDPAEDNPLEDRLEDPLDLDWESDRRELSALLNRALTLLPAETTAILIAHFIQQASHDEIAGKLGLKTSAVAMRLQRAKQALLRCLKTHFQADMLAMGLAVPDRLKWNQTNIWCPNCGQTRLSGRFERGTPGGMFALRCPRCDPNPDELMSSLDLSIPSHANILGGVRAFKPAWTRLLMAVSSYCLQAVTTQAATCLACGKPARIEMISKHENQDQPAIDASIQVFCPDCEWRWNASRWSLVMSLPESQRFWQENPRIRTLPARQIEAQGLPAMVTRVESVSSAARLEVVSTRDTYQFLEIHAGLNL